MQLTEQAEPEPFQTVAEYAQRLKVSRGTVFTWLRRGLPSVVVGRTRRIRTRAADEWLAAGGAMLRRRSKRSNRSRGRRRDAGMDSSASACSMSTRVVPLVLERNAYEQDH